MAAIEVEHISKKYGEVEALRDISLSVNEGEIFGLIGPDGAGKTTLFRILTTLIRANSGSATVDGLDVVKDYKKIRNRVGYMSAQVNIFQSEITFYGCFLSEVQQK